jgi:hypothetical protein
MAEPSTFVSTVQVDSGTNGEINQELLNGLILSQMTTQDYENLGLNVTQDPGATQNLDVISIADLLNEQSIILQKEEADVNRLNAFFAPTMDSLRAALLAWATKNFPPVEKIGTLVLDPPDLCSDGEKRTLPYYIEYILKDSITNKLNGLNAKTQGMSFTFSWVEKSISLYVTRL